LIPESELSIIEFEKDIEFDEDISCQLFDSISNSGELICFLLAFFKLAISPFV